MRRRWRVRLRGVSVILMRCTAAETLARIVRHGRAARERDKVAYAVGGFEGAGTSGEVGKREMGEHRWVGFGVNCHLGLRWLR